LKADAGDEEGPYPRGDPSVAYSGKT